MLALAPLGRGRAQRIFQTNPKTGALIQRRSAGEEAMSVSPHHLSTTSHYSTMILSRTSLMPFPRTATVPDLPTTMALEW